jgi:hypothetical protein
MTVLAARVIDERGFQKRPRKKKSRNCSARTPGADCQKNPPMCPTKLRPHLPGHSLGSAHRMRQRFTVLMKYDNVASIFGRCR